MTEVTQQMRVALKEDIEHLADDRLDITMHVRNKALDNVSATAQKKLDDAKKIVTDERKSAEEIKKALDAAATAMNNLLKEAGTLKSLGAVESSALTHLHELDNHVLGLGC